MMSDWIKRSRHHPLHNAQLRMETECAIPDELLTTRPHTQQRATDDPTIRLDPLLSCSSIGPETKDEPSDKDEPASDDHHPAFPKRRRLKRCHSDSDSSVSNTDPPNTHTNNSNADDDPPPYISSCPIGSFLHDSESATCPGISTGTREEHQVELSPIGSKHVPSRSGNKGLVVMTNCLDLSKQTTEHIVNTLGGESEEARKVVKQHIGNGRTSIARSPTVSTIEEILRPYRPLNVPLLKEYQLTGIQWLLALHEQRQFPILADEMGLGKTAQTITFLNFLYATEQLTEPSIVACPATLVDNWMMELQKWAPNLRALKYQGGQQEKRELIEKFERSLYKDEKRFHVTVASLQAICSSWDRSLFFKKHKFGYLIVDEAHNLKNSTSQLYRHIKRHIVSERRLLLTGSPIQNEINELQNILLLLLPDVLDSESLQLATATYSQLHTDHELKLQYRSQSLSSSCSTFSESPPSCSPDRAHQEPADKSNDSSKIAPDVEFLQLVFAPFILRRLKFEVINDLPAKICIVERCTLEGRQKELYLAELLGTDSELARQELSSLPIRSLRNGKRSDDETTQQGVAEAAVHAAAQRASSSSSSSSSSPSPSPSSSPKVKAKQSLRPSLKNQRFIQNLMFRLRRICNHPLLYKGYYSSQQIEDVCHYFHTHVDGYREQPYEKVKSTIELWCDYEIHQAALDSPPLSTLQLPSSEFLESTKIRRMLEIVDSTLARDAKALIFSQFTTYLDVITETLQLHRPHISFFRLDGTTVMADRHRMINQFGTDPGVSLFLLSTKAGGVGLNLTAADTVILMDQDWNPHNDRQAEDRAHRLGQTKDVTVYRLCCRESLEESILRCGKRKLDLDQAFGGNTDLLSAAILKDCLSSTLAAPTSNRIALDSTDTSVSITTSEQPTQPTTHKQKEFRDTRPPKKERQPQNSHTGATATNRDPTQSTQQQGKDEKGQRSPQGDQIPKVNSRNSNPEKGSPKKNVLREPKKNNENIPVHQSKLSLQPRKDALLNRFGGGAPRQQDNNHKRQRTESNYERSKKVKKS